MKEKTKLSFKLKALDRIKNFTNANVHVNEWAIASFTRKSRTPRTVNWRDFASRVFYSAR